MAKTKKVKPGDVLALQKQREQLDAKVKARVRKQSRDNDEDTIEQDPKKKFLALALRRWHTAAEAEAPTRKESLDDLEFSIGNQWDQQIQARRQLDGRPCHTINRLPQFIRLVTNEQRQQRPAIQINPVGDGATRETARILQGMVRHIEVNSDAEVAYDSASECAVRMGFGFWHIIREYLQLGIGRNQGKTFDQEIKIKRIKNPLSVYFDPTCVEHDYSDAEYAFIVEDMSREVFKEMYSGSETASLTDMTSIGDIQKVWVQKDTIRVATYYYVERTPRALVFLNDGRIYWRDELPAEEEFGKDDIAAERTVHQRTVKCAKISALDILEGDEDGKPEGRDIQNPYIPLVPVLGDDFDVNGKRHLAGIVRYAKDPQRLYNYWISAATETIALAPRSPFVGAVGQFKSKTSMWRDANIRNFAFLEYDPVSIEGQAAPPPQRMTAEPPIQALGAMIRQADNDLKGTTGIYDASLGQKGPDESGKAILVRQKQGDVATLNFSDNLSRSIRHTGRIIIAWIPTTYDKPRIQRIINPDQTIEHVGVFNSMISDMDEEEAKKELTPNSAPKPGEMPGIQQVFDIGVGTYDVTVSTGPSYQSKRQEAVQAMMTLVGAYPALMQAAGDLLISNMDWPGAQAIADRLKKLLPQELQDVDSPDPRMQIVALQAQLKQMMQQHTILVQELNTATDIIKTKKMDLESKERIADLNAQVQILVAEAKVQGEAALSKLDGELQIIMHRLDTLNMAKGVGDGSTSPVPGPTPPPIGGPGQGQ